MKVRKLPTFEDEVGFVVSDFFKGMALTRGQADAIRKAIGEIAAVNGDISESGLRKAADAIRSVVD